jgi:hypothetical protein
MSEPRSYRLQFYRQEVDDVGIDDIHLPNDDGVNLGKTATKALLGYFNNPNIVAAQRPHHARVITHDEMSIIFTLMATGPETVERV